MVAARWLAAVLLLVPGIVIADSDRPSFIVMTDATIGVTFPVSALSDDEVKAQLKSGLTTTFVAIATSVDRARSMARVEIRYDLWDEKYIVRRIDFDGAASRSQFSSLEELERWWRTSPLRLLKKGTPDGRVDLELRVLPFSAAEERDTREWLSKGGGSVASRGAAAEGPAGAAPSTTVIEALIGTSLEARPLLTFRWRSTLVLQGSR